MSSPSPHSSTVSSPAKVLLSGGYLVMDQPHTATVLALDQRFFASASIEPGAGSLDEGINVHISLASPQFGELREYVFSSGRAGEGASLRAANSTAAAATNPYVELPLLYGLTLARALRERRSDGRLARSARGRPLAESGRGVRLVVDLAADNGFYSQVAELRARGLPLSAASLRSLPRLLTPRRAANGELAKTGLGSSATLVTSLVGALLQAAGVVRLPTAGGGGALTPAQRADLELVHALAQLCHCAAQGKVGSGFDVCAATFGSQRYCRFSPAALEPVLRLPEGIPPPPALLLAAVGAAAPSGHGSADAPAAPLDHQLQAFQLPPGVEVMMADVCCGAHTPSMVKRVQAWRASHPAAVELWPAYAAASARVQAALQRLVALHTRWASSAAPEEGWEDELARLGAMDQSEWAVEATLDGSELAAALDDLRAATIEMRGLLRAISTSSGVPIEPPAQTALLDATMAQRGVLMAVVPGAGGSDAVVALILPSAKVNGMLATRQRVGALWRCWAPDGDDGSGRAPVCELPVGESRPCAGGHNGLLLEGAEEAERLAAAARPLRRDAAGEVAARARAIALAALVVAAAVAALTALRRR